MLIYIIGVITGNPDYREQFARTEDADGNWTSREAGI